MLLNGLIALLNLLALSKTCLGEPSDTTDFFPDIENNLTKLSWAHAVNNASYLEKVLSGDVMMIEADIVLGTLIDDDPSNLQPVMGHPPAIVSDISLHDFLQRINEFNSQGVSMKGVKLDFKSIGVFEMSLEIIEKLYSQVTYPVWINADILPGPVNSISKPVDANRFLQGASPYKSVMLSTGWTTLYGGIVTQGSYTSNHINQMVDALLLNEVKQKVTFPVRAGLAANSKQVMLELLQRTNSSPFNSTLTIWSSQGDFVDIDKLRDLILECGLEKVYLDVPKEISDQLNLNSKN